DGTFLLGSGATAVRVNETWYFRDEGPANGGYDLGEDIFRTGQRPGKLDTGVPLVGAEWADTSTVSLLGTASYQYVDRNGNGAYDLGEPLYRDEAAPASTYTPGNRIQTEVYGDWWEVDKVGAEDNSSLLRGISVGLSRGQTLRLSAGTYATSLGSLTSNSTQFELPPETALAGAGMGVTLVTVSPWRNVLDAYTMVKCISGCTIRDIGLIGHAGSPTLVDADGTTTGTLGPTAIDAPDSAPLVVFDAATTGANLCTDSLTTPTKLYQKASGVCGTAAATGFLLNSGAVTGIASVLDTPWYFHDTNSSGTCDPGEDIFIGGSALQA